jgi:hypothetical protein
MVDVTPSASRSVLPATPMEILKRTDRTLAYEVSAALGARPALDLVGQERLAPPHPPWVAPPLPTDSEVLARWTGYRVGRVELTRNVAYVDPRFVDPRLMEALRDGTTSLGELFEDPEVDKMGFEFGTDEDAERFDADLLETIARGGLDLRPYVWRRYFAAFRGVITFVVIEALPVLTWERLLNSDLERAALRRLVS